jgi:hypothetical protein
MKKKSVVLFGVLLSSVILLSGCGGGSSSNTSAGTDSGGAGSKDSNAPKKQVFSAQINPHPYGGYSCLSSGPQNDVCWIDFQITNTSNAPQTLVGTSFVSNEKGQVFKALSAENSDVHANDNKTLSLDINPGETVSRTVEFKLPVGTTITNLYKADGPEAPHYFDLSLNYSVGG